MGLLRCPGKKVPGLWWSFNNQLIEVDNLDNIEFTCFLTSQIKLAFNNKNLRTHVKVIITNYFRDFCIIKIFA